MTVDLNQSPHIAFDQREQLPKTSGLYIVKQRELIVYVGVAENLRKRWKNHHRTPEIAALGDGVEIHYLEMPHEQAASIELATIKELRPQLNRRTYQELDTPIPSDAPVSRCTGRIPVPSDPAVAWSPDLLALLFVPENRSAWGDVVAITQTCINSTPTLEHYDHAEEIG